MDFSKYSLYTFIFVYFFTNPTNGKSSDKIMISFVNANSEIEAQYDDNKTFWLKVKLTYPKSDTLIETKYGIKIINGDASSLDYRFEQKDLTKFYHSSEMDSIVSIPIIILTDSEKQNEANEYILIELISNEQNVTIDKNSNTHKMTINSAANNQKKREEESQNKQTNEELKKLRMKGLQSVIGNWITTGVSVDITQIKKTNPLDFFFAFDISSPTESAKQWGYGLQMKSATFASRQYNVNITGANGYYTEDELGKYPVHSEYMVDKNTPLAFNSAVGSYKRTSQYISLNPYILYTFWQQAEKEIKVNRFYGGLGLAFNYWNSIRTPYQIEGIDALKTKEDIIIVYRDVLNKDTTDISSSRIEYGPSIFIGLDFRSLGLGDLKTILSIKYLLLETNSNDNSNIQKLFLSKIPSTDTTKYNYYITLDEKNSYSKGAFVLDYSVVLNVSYYGGIQISADFRYYPSLDNNNLFPSEDVFYSGFNISKNIDLNGVFKSIFGSAE